MLQLFLVRLVLSAEGFRPALQFKRDWRDLK